MYLFNRNDTEWPKSCLKPAYGEGLVKLLLMRTLLRKVEEELETKHLGSVQMPRTWTLPALLPPGKEVITTRIETRMLPELQGTSRRVPDPLPAIYVAKKLSHRLRSDKDSEVWSVVVILQAGFSWDSWASHRSFSQNCFWNGFGVTKTWQQWIPF